MIYQLLPDTAGFQEGIQDWMPPCQVQWQQGSLEPWRCLHCRSTRGSPVGDAAARQAPRPASLVIGW